MREPIDRLLRAAAPGEPDAEPEMPFGFDTRVMASWRAQTHAPSEGINRLVRRVALVAIAIIMLAGAGAYIDAERNQDTGEPFANEFAIADTAIEDVLGP